ncbi:class I SAM-dependent methyltransferase [Sediminitomix flava]|uniref:Methyltransferase family protein n=1 Tax=Sediminitomix flava TaxID=379075 RepID=A0A315YXA6_SEDFL|nr:SAM-dependent methyltransferase [Sediminitomix flava]PWJ34206.1 methyltransferase family protein [Sediminitomix flava]
MSTDKLEQFIQFLQDSLQQSTFVELKLANKRDKESDLRTLTAKVVKIKKGTCLSFVYRHETKDITKNFLFEEAVTLIHEHLKTDFYQADLKTTSADYFLNINNKNVAKLKTKQATKKEAPKQSHDKQKHRFIKAEGNVYLKELGVVTADDKVKNSRQDKYRQINKYVEIIDGILKSVKFDGRFNVVDMGAGKGYLTFALYDYLTNVVNREANVIGVELRQNLVEYCNSIAEKAGFEHLSFQEGTIQEATLEAIDVLIALHACDTATDDSIYRGIKANSKVIICAPCCHKQVRKQLCPTDDLSEITQFGILKERQAELLTDGIRALILEAYGYKTKVFEFISTEHTPKNVLVVGVKQKDLSEPDPEVIKKIENIKQTHGLKYHYLQEILDKGLDVVLD